MSIHDEVCLSVPESNAYEALIVAKREFLGAGKELPADLRCDVEISNCWSGPTLVFNDKHELIKEV